MTTHQDAQLQNGNHGDTENDYQPKSYSNSSTTTPDLSTPAPGIDTPPLPASASTSTPSVSSSAKRQSVHVSANLKPIGIINEHNECFLNSTFQALSATAPLAALLTSSSQSPLQPLPSSSLPPPIVSATRIPSLQPESIEPPLYSLLPVTRAFSTALHRSWKLKDAGGGTMGPGETSSGRSMSLRSLLREISRKYDQYDDYQQQDAHELLRHLLDSMEMEEKDVVKKLQPLPPPTKKRRKGRGKGRESQSDLRLISPLPSPMPSPAQSMPSSPIKSTFADQMSASRPWDKEQRLDGDTMESLTTSPGTAVADGHGGQVETSTYIPKEERLVPFVDVLFGGSLASVVVCAKCKSVSHTYEGFLDISLSLKEDDPKPRKRDRLRAMAQRLVPRGSSKNTSDTHSNSSHAGSGSVTVSDGELSETEAPPSSAGSSRRRSFDQDERSETSLGRRDSKSLGGLKNKTSFSFRRKEKRSTSANSRTPASPDMDKTPPTMPAIPTSPALQQPHPHAHHDHLHSAAPTPAQAAYISRILNPPQGASDPLDPLQRLKLANSGEAVPNAVPVEFSLIDSLRSFTSVEVLEGENAFACRKCWKIKHGRYAKHEATVREEDEDGTVSVMSSSIASDLSSPPLLANSRVPPPSISIHDSPKSIASGQDGERLRQGGRVPSSASQNSIAQAPSPLRRQVEDAAFVEQMAHATLDSYGGNSASMSSADVDAEVDIKRGAVSDSSDGLSDSDSSDDEAAATANGASENGHSNSKNHKRKTSHFVMGRAFKRYLIAEAPEIMVFHFKRFKQMYKTSMSFSSFYNLKKIDDYIPFPEMLDLAPFLAPKRKDYKVNPTPNGPHATYMDWAHPDQGPDLQPVMYKLYAVVVHLGTMIGGHYIAYCLVDPEKVFGTSKSISENIDENADGTRRKASVTSLGDGSPTQGENRGNDRRVWCYCSDTSIRLASVSEVLAARAYLCFYEKVHA